MERASFGLPAQEISFVIKGSSSVVGFIYSFGKKKGYHYGNLSKPTEKELYSGKL